MIRAIIADDELLARKQIMTALSEFPKIKICAQCEDGLETVNAIVEHKPDLVFLDIQMPELDGMDVINTIGADQMPFVIFVTAYDQYAVAAFEKHAFDYLLKPFSPKRFQEAVSRVVQFIEHQNKEQSAENLMKVIEELKPKEQYLKRVAIRSTSRIYFLPVSKIDWIEAAGNYVDIHMGDKTHLLRETMGNIESNLDPEHFIRIHRSAIVNFNFIHEIQPDTYDYIVLLKNGKTLGMSRRYKEKLNSLIQQRF